MSDLPSPFTNNQGVTFTPIKRVTKGKNANHGNLVGVIEAITLPSGKADGYYIRWHSDVPQENDRPNGCYGESQCGPNGD